MAKLSAAFATAAILAALAAPGFAADINTQGAPGSASPSAGMPGTANSGSSSLQGQSFSNTAPGQSDNSSSSGITGRDQSAQTPEQFTPSSTGSAPSNQATSSGMSGASSGLTGQSNSAGSGAR
jgi:hypothetical protein